MGAWPIISLIAEKAVHVTLSSSCYSGAKLGTPGADCATRDVCEEGHKYEEAEALVGEERKHGLG